MSIRPKVRFEVFKRDGFTCAYCGRKPPDVTLEADHILPLSEGGDSDIENLITSCWDCNRGKGAGLLDDRAPVSVDLEAKSEEIAERERQLRAYHAVRNAVAKRQDEQFNRVWDYWFDLWGETSMSRYHLPWKSSLRTFIDQLGEAEVMQAMDVARDKFHWPSSNAARYFAGVCKRKVAKLEGRVVPCVVCGREMVLDPGEDPTGRWYHVACKEEQEKRG